MNKTYTLAACLVAVHTAFALPNVTVNSVVQRWPWNNKVDITYTVSDAQVSSAGVYYGLRFALTANGRTYSFEGSSIGASAESGDGSMQHVATWTAPQGIVASDCSLTVTLFPTNVPSGNDYMIVDLANGNVWFEGLLNTQDASSSHYNVSEYKTSKMVLRKIPRWSDRDALPNAASLPVSGYPTGHSWTITTSSTNSPRYWTTDRDYYICMFPVTVGQYAKIYGKNDSTTTPTNKVSWNQIRVAGTAPSASVPSLANGTVLQRLNYKTGRYFDLPTEIMFEIAERAGATTEYYWGDVADSSKVVCSENSSTTVAVGSKDPNDWGLYDMAGNVWEWCRDDDTFGDLGDATDPFIPASNGGANRKYRGGGSYSDKASSNAFKASWRNGNAPNMSWSAAVGFRFAIVMD